MQGKELTSGEFEVLVREFADRDSNDERNSTQQQTEGRAPEQRLHRVVEVTGTLVNGEIVFDAPGSSLPIRVDKNAIYSGELKIIVRVRS